MCNKDFEVKSRPIGEGNYASYCLGVLLLCNLNLYNFFDGLFPNSSSNIKFSKGIFSVYLHERLDLATRSSKLPLVRSLPYARLSALRS